MINLLPNCNQIVEKNILAKAIEIIIDTENVLLLKMIQNNRYFSLETFINFSEGLITKIFEKYNKEIVDILINEENKKISFVSLFLLNFNISN